MKNNNGQVLVLFVILLPILLLLTLMSIELGDMYLDKTKTANTIREIITNNLNNYDENTNERVNILIDENIIGIETKEVFISENEIKIHIIQQKKFFGRNANIEYKYKGTKENEKITISEG